MTNFRILCLAALAPVIWGGGAAAAGGEELKVLARYDLPAAGQSGAATDIRFATDDSVFLARGFGGVQEVSLKEPLKVLRGVVPDVKTLDGPRNYQNLAASENFLAVGDRSGHVAWRPTALQRTGAVGFYVEQVNIPADIDVSEDRILILGEGRADTAADRVGGIAFLGRMSATGFKDYHPVLFDVRGAGTPSLANCAPYKLGGTRFLPDGSFVVVPGFQPGAHLFDARGKPVRTWSGRETGLSTDCSTISKAESDRLWSFDVPQVTSWLNGERILDDILPLEEGPGLLIRSARADGKTAWELRVLRKAGGVAVYKIPFTGAPSDRLSGDVRAGRIALLRFPWHYFLGASRGEILLLEAPHDRTEAGR